MYSWSPGDWDRSIMKPGLYVVSCPPFIVVPIAMATDPRGSIGALRGRGKKFPGCTRSAWLTSAEGGSHLGALANGTQVGTRHSNYISVRDSKLCEDKDSRCVYFVLVNLSVHSCP